VPLADIDGAPLSDVDGVPIPPAGSHHNVTTKVASQAPKPVVAPFMVPPKPPVPAPTSLSDDPQSRIQEDRRRARLRRIEVCCPLLR
jgi:hypothetical protein